MYPHEINQVRSRVQEAFKQLRKKEEIYARMNFLCCSSCATSKLYNMITEEKSEYKGVAFFHQQNNDRFEEGEDFHIGFGHKDENQENRQKDLEVGRTIQNVLEENGVVTEWENDPFKKIEVKVEDSLEKIQD